MIPDDLDENVTPPDEIEDVKRIDSQTAALTREHYEALIDSGFNEAEAFTLTVQYDRLALVGE